MPLSMRLWAMRVVAFTLVLFAASTCQAEVRLAAHLDGGVGMAKVRALPNGTSASATMAAGLSTPTAIGLRATLGVIATAGDDIGAQVPEGPFAGNRSLTTIVVGIERSDRRDARGLFASAGVGLGHMTSSHATKSWRDFSSSDWRYPSRNLLGLGFAGSVGYRTHGGLVATGLTYAGVGESPL